MSPERAALAAAIDGLYEAFAASGLTPELRSDNPWRPDARWLAKQPLRRVPAAALAEFAFELGYSIGSADDIRYFLPRLLELFVRHELALDAEGVLGKLAIARWHAWPAAEQRAVQAFLGALLDVTLAESPHRILEVVRGIALVVDDLAPYLARIRARDDLTGVRGLGALAEHVADQVLLDRRGGRWLKKRPEQQAQIEAWLRDPASLAQVEAVRGRLTEAASEEERSWLDEVSYALGILRGGGSADDP